MKLENCAGEDAIITVEDGFSVKLNKKCELVPQGCFMNKAFGTAMAKFKVQKDGIVMKEGKMDMCAAIDQAPSEAKDMLKLFGAPSSCPVSEEKICANDHKVDMSKYKSMLGMARGHLIIDSEIKHDTVSLLWQLITLEAFLIIFYSILLLRANRAFTLKSKYRRTRTRNHL